MLDKLTSKIERVKEELCEESNEDKSWSQSDKESITKSLEHAQAKLQDKKADIQGHPAINEASLKEYH